MLFIIGEVSFLKAEREDFLHLARLYTYNCTIFKTQRKI
jgi:hypothetical protein